MAENNREDSRTAKAGPAVKRRRVRAAKVRPDDTAEHLGLVAVEPETAAAIASRRESPEERIVRELVATKKFHGKYVALPIGDVGRIKAQATARSWQKPHNIDGRRIKLESVAFPRTDSGSRNLWAVAVKYVPSKQPVSKQ